MSELSEEASANENMPEESAVASSAPEELGAYLLDIYRQAKTVDRVNGQDFFPLFKPLLHKRFQFTCLHEDSQAIRRDIWGHHKYPASVTGRLKGVPQVDSLESGLLIIGHWMFWRDDIRLVAAQGQPLVEVHYLPS